MKITVNEVLDATYSAFDPTFFKNRTPGCSGATTTIAGFSAPSVRNGAFSVYGSSCTFDSEYFVLDHVGYFYAPLTGTYNITISNADDAVFLWVDGRDGKTVSGWNRGNADAITNKNSNTASLTQVTAIAGSYTPIRIMYAQAQGVGGFGVSIFDPAGNELLASRQDSSAYIVQYGCGTDATAAPQFAPWGMES